MQYDTGGNLIIFYDMCACCDLDTGGNHQHWCPCYQSSIQKETYAQFGVRLKVEIDNHPEWGWKLL